MNNCPSAINATYSAKEVDSHNKAYRKTNKVYFFILLVLTCVFFDLAMLFLAYCVGEWSKLDQCRNGRTAVYTFNDWVCLKAAEDSGGSLEGQIGPGSFADPPCNNININTIDTDNTPYPAQAWLVETALLRRNCIAKSKDKSAKLIKYSDLGLPESNTTRARNYDCNDVPYPGGRTSGLSFD